MRCFLFLISALSVFLSVSQPLEASEVRGAVDFFIQWADAEWLGDLSAEWTRPFGKPYCPADRVKSCEELKQFLSGAQNCNELMQLLNGKPLSIELTSNAEDVLLTHLMACGHISAMGRLRPAKVTLFDAEHILKDIYYHLDATSIPWSLGGRSKYSGGGTFAQLKARKPSENDDYIYLDLHERSYLLRPLFMGALSDDGPQVVYAEFQEDTHPKFSRQTGVVFLVRDKSGGPIRATPVTLLPLEYSKAPLSIDHVYWGQ